MTLKELCKLVDDTNFPVVAVADSVPFAIYPRIGIDHKYAWYFLDNTSLYSNEFRLELGLLNKNIYTLIDYLDIEKTNVKSNSFSCTCDFYSVILVTGCQCGGK
jgi:hypothetical protein